jgi:uncharacterized protein YbjT (DUF2867 family)
MKYLVIGATGNIGSRVTRRLIARGERPSVFVRSAKKAKTLFGAEVDLHVGDLERPRSSLAAALAGVDGTFLVSNGPALDARDRTVAFAAKSAGVRQVVKLSTLDVDTGVGMGPWHARIWRAVREGRLATVSDGVIRSSGEGPSHSTGGPRRTPTPFSSGWRGRPDTNSNRRGPSGWPRLWRRLVK